MNLAQAFKNPQSNTHLKYYEPSRHAKFKLILVDSETVATYISKLDIKKATGLDQIPVKLVTLSAPVISSPVSHIINFSFQNGVFPNTLKIAKVIPLYKKGSPKECKNYRPISILPIFSKIIEK